MHRNMFLSMKDLVCSCKDCMKHIFLILEGLWSTLAPKTQQRISLGFGKRRKKNIKELQVCSTKQMTPSSLCVCQVKPGFGQKRMGVTALEKVRFHYLPQKISFKKRRDSVKCFRAGLGMKLEINKSFTNTVWLQRVWHTNKMKFSSFLCFQ